MISSSLASRPPRQHHPTRRMSSNYFAPFPGGRLSRAQDHVADSQDDDTDDGLPVDGNAEQRANAPSEDESENQDENTSLLPLFSAAHLDSLPIYNTTHSCRLLIIQRCETTLSWEQLRTPQVSRFLVKPIQLQIRNSHFSRATLYALIANCLQFQMEAQLHPGSVGVSTTRASLAELLAIRLIREYTTMELIDALSYDFNPLQGSTNETARSAGASRRLPTYTSANPSLARTSTLEVAIRAQAKKFLAHPVVVQHLEAIWAGTIVFHSAADSLHRHPSQPVRKQRRNYGVIQSILRWTNIQDDDGDTVKLDPPVSNEQIRRSVTLYNPKNASLFKLSRLRVPRYRQVFSTLSYAIMLGLFLAILIQRSLSITSLEVIFWFWSIGFMLDEIVGFSEQGFGLYILSVWNAFDIGILILFFAYYILRLYGIVMADDQKHLVADKAYDVLASTAVLLFPRLFSLLDHYRYFSQLLIAFRLMIRDLAAVLILVAISCSGFFVAFTLSFVDDVNANGVAYALFQILMGYTPAAWDAWKGYNVLGKIIMTLFLIICHFLVVTILITVLTNSFMTIARNANDEHQYLFAVNTISMVKSDALFSYIAPTNIAGWLFSPVRYFIPFRRYVSINRSIIKATHFPILFTIFAYERLMLSQYSYDPIELIEIRGRSRKVQALNLSGRDLFSPTIRLREPSITTFHKDRALAEVFRKPFSESSKRRSKDSPGLGGSHSVVDSWMKGVVSEGGASSPTEQPRSLFEHPVTRRPRARRSMTSQAMRTESRAFSATTRSTRRSPIAIFRKMPGISRDVSGSTTNLMEAPPDTDADGDDEALNVHERPKSRASARSDKLGMIKNDTSPFLSLGPQLRSPLSTGSISSENRSPVVKSGVGTLPIVSKVASRRHNRHSSTATILFNPLQDGRDALQPSSEPTATVPMLDGPTSATSNSPAQIKRSRRSGFPKARPIMPPRDTYRTAPTLSPFSVLGQTRTRSMDAIALDLASDIGDNRYRPNSNLIGAMPASFQTQMAYAQTGMRELERERERERQEDGMMGRIVLARMNILEEGFKDILREVKDWRNASSQPTSAGEDFRAAASPRKLAGKGRKGKARIALQEAGAVDRNISGKQPEVKDSDVFAD